SNIYVKIQIIFGENTIKNKNFHVTYDRLLIATGTDPLVPDSEGMHIEGIHYLKTLKDGEAIQSDLKDDVQHVTIVGGGYVGLEMAESFISLGKKVTLIQRGEQIAKIFDADMAELIHQEAERHGVHLILGESVEGFTGEPRVEKVITNKSSYPTDLV